MAISRIVFKGNATILKTMDWERVREIFSCKETNMKNTITVSKVYLSEKVSK